MGIELHVCGDPLTDRLEALLALADGPADPVHLLSGGVAALSGPLEIVVLGQRIAGGAELIGELLEAALGLRYARAGFPRPVRLKERLVEFLLGLLRD